MILSVNVLCKVCFWKKKFYSISSVSVWQVKSDGEELHKELEELRSQVRDAEDIRCEEMLAERKDVIEEGGTAGAEKINMEDLKEVRTELK